MATLLTVQNAATPVSDVREFEVHDFFDLSATIADTDVIRTRLLAKNIKVLGFKMTVPELDTGADAITLTGRLNDGTTQVNAFVDSTVGQAGGVQLDDDEALAGFVTDSELWFAEILVSTAPGTGAAVGRVHIILRCTGALNDGEGTL